MEATTERRVLVSWRPQATADHSRDTMVVFQVPPMPVIVPEIQISCAWNQAMEAYGVVPISGKTAWRPLGVEDGVLTVFSLGKSTHSHSPGSTEWSRSAAGSVLDGVEISPPATLYQYQFLRYWLRQYCIIYRVDT
ncbi:unnamed protein product [Urochloa humidicola]